MFYKVLDRYGDKLNSTGHYTCRLTYDINIWTKPEYGKLFVFKGINGALVFNNGCQEIWECEVINPEEASFMTHWAAESETKKNFWELYDSLKYCDRYTASQFFVTDLYIPPNDTFYCDAVKIIRKV